MTDTDLLDRFAALFEPLEELIEPDMIIPVGRQTTDLAAIEALYALLPARFPKLYEKLILSYRWQSSTTGDGYRLLANPIGIDFNGLTA